MARLNPGATKYNQHSVGLEYLPKRHRRKPFAVLCAESYSQAAIICTTRADTVYTMTLGNEQQLVLKIQSGDRVAFEQLMDAYEKHAFTGLLCALPGNASDAEDVAALEVFHGVYKSIRSRF